MFSIDQELKGMNGAIAYNAYRMTLLLVQATQKIGMLEIGDAISEIEIQQAQIEALRALDDNNKIKQGVFIEVKAILEKASEEIYALCKIARDKNGVPISTRQLNNFNAVEIEEILYKCWCACLALNPKIFF